MRFIVLSEERVSMLTGIYKYSKFHHVCERAKCILLSNEDHTISELRAIFKVDDNL